MFLPIVSKLIIDTLLMIVYKMTVNDRSQSDKVLACCCLNMKEGNVQMEKNLLVLCLVLGLSGCVTAQSLTSECFRLHDKFDEAVTCAQTEIRNGFGYSMSENTDSLDVVLLYMDVIKKKVKQKKLTSIDGQMLIVREFEKRREKLDVLDAQRRLALDSLARELLAPSSSPAPILVPRQMHCQTYGNSTNCWEN